MIESTKQEKLDFAPSLNLKTVGAKMARPRHQKGWLKQKRGQWLAHWYAYVRLEDGREVRRRRKRVVGHISKCWKEEFRKELYVKPELDTLVLPHSPSGWHCETTDEYLKRTSQPTAPRET